MFPSSTKRKPFHAVVRQRRQRNVQKSVMHVQSCCFANLNLLVFCHSLCRRRRRRRRRPRCLSSLMWKSHFANAKYFTLHYKQVLIFTVVPMPVGLPQLISAALHLSHLF